jgi:hypothetical protein
MSTEKDALDALAADSEAKGLGEQPPGSEADSGALEPVGEPTGPGTETATDDGPVLIDELEARTTAPEEEPTGPGTETADDDGPVLIDELESELADTDADAASVYSPPDMSQMLFVDVVLLLPATHPVVVLQEADAPFRELRIPVGGAEGIAIGYAARAIATPRPLTHELFTSVLEEYGMTIDVVRITEVHGAAFSAELVVSGPQGTRVVDCRPSDAIALALRQRIPVPIVAAPMVLAIAGTDPAGAN